MASEIFQPPMASIECNDADELAGAEAAYHWTEEYTQLSRGTLKSCLNIAQLGGIQFALQEWNQSFRVHGECPPNALSIAIPLEFAAEIIWHGHSLCKRHLMVTHSSREYALTTLGQTKLYMISIDRETLLKEAEAIHCSEIEPILEGKRHLICPDLWRLNAVMDYLQDLWQLVETAPLQAIAPQMQILIYEDFIPLFLNLLVEDDSRNNIVCPSKRSILVKKAEDFIASHRPHPLTLRDLYEHLQVSERTLRYSFQECLGMSPMAYVKVQRLHGVRRELKASAPKLSNINQIATRWGFWHMGQFSIDYKKHFGESPSKTLETDE